MNINNFIKTLAATLLDASRGTWSVKGWIRLLFGGEEGGIPLLKILIIPRTYEKLHWKEQYRFSDQRDHSVHTHADIDPVTLFLG